MGGVAPCCTGNFELIRMLLSQIDGTVYTINDDNTIIRHAADGHNSAYFIEAFVIFYGSGTNCL